MSLERVWGEFGESPNALQTHSSFPKKQWKNKKQWKHMSLERVWRISKLTPNSQRNLCLMSFFQKNEKWVWRISKIFPNSKKICVHNFFLSGCTHILFEKSCARIFLLSLERVWRFSKLIFSCLFKKKNNFLKKHQAKISLWVWSEFGVSLERVWRISKLTPNSQRNLCLMTFFKKNDFFKKKRKKISLENLQTLSKLQKNMRAQLFLSGCTFFF